MALTKKLFRNEALAHQANKLEGEVLVLPKVSQLLVTCVITLWVAFAIVWLLTGEYARKETVGGWIEPEAGVTRVFSNSAGIIDQVFVANGQHVNEGDRLFLIQRETILNDGSAFDSLVETEYTRQREFLDAQMDLSRKVSEREEAKVQGEIRAARDDLELLEKQQATLAKRLDIVTLQEERIRSLTVSGTIPRSDQEAFALQRLEVLSDLEAVDRLIQARQADIDRLSLSIQIVPDQNQIELATLRGALSKIEMEFAQVSSSQSYLVRAPRPGVVGNLQAQHGMRALERTPLLTISPEGTSFVTNLLVPVSAIGFVEVGQNINIRYDAFPYQKFGLYQGRITDVANTIQLPGEIVESPIQIHRPVYRVSAVLESNSVNAYGREVDLRPGMTLSADIELGQRTLFEWLMEPLLSLRGRL